VVNRDTDGESLLAADTGSLFIIETHVKRNIVSSSVSLDRLWLP
jgi:hypothetical protein